MISIIKYKRRERHLQRDKSFIVLFKPFTKNNFILFYIRHHHMIFVTSS